MQKRSEVFATFFGIGYLPRMPGTYASLCAAGIALLLHDYRGAYWGITGLITLGGFLVAGRCEKIFSEKDSPKIVIDEVSGMLLSYAIMPFSWQNLVAGFFFFRFFDIVKPFPLYQIQRLPGSAGVMLDDIGAAVYTMLSLFLAGRMVMWWPWG